MSAKKDALWGTQSYIEIEGNCGYGALDYELWPHGSVGSIGAEHPLIAGHITGGCGACVRIFCPKGQVLQVLRFLCICTSYMWKKAFTLFLQAVDSP